MTPFVTRLAAPALLCFVALAAAAPVPKDNRPVISPKNVNQLRPVREVPHSVYRITNGPRRGEIYILDHLNNVELADDVTVRTKETFAAADKPSDFAASPDGKLRAWLPQGSAAYTVENTTTGKTFQIEIGDHPGFASFSPDSKLIAIGHTVWNPNAPGASYSEMRVYDVSGKLIRSLDKSGPGGLTPVFSPDGKTLAVGNRNDKTQLFEVATGKLLHTLDKSMTQGIAFSPNSKTLAAAYVEGPVRLWEVATGKLLHEAPSGSKETYSVDWNPKGDVLVTSGREGQIVLWDPENLTKLVKLDAPDWVIQARFTADGTRLLTAGGSDYGRINKKIVVWALEGDKP
jgi:WD40 repeat protein